MTCPTSPSAHPRSSPPSPSGRSASCWVELDPEQLTALAEGRGQLVFQATSPRATRPRPPAATECGDLDATVSAIRALGSRAEVADYLRAHDGRLTVPVLKQVVRRLGPTVATGRSKAELKRNIIEGTAGFRERSMAMSRGAWS